MPSVGDPQVAQRNTVQTVRSTKGLRPRTADTSVFPAPSRYRHGSAKDLPLQDKGRQLWVVSGGPASVGRPSRGAYPRGCPEQSV
jgi:hypothetical protein